MPSLWQTCSKVIKTYSFPESDAGIAARVGGALRVLWGCCGGAGAVMGKSYFKLYCWSQEYNSSSNCTWNEGSFRVKVWKHIPVGNGKTGTVYYAYTMDNICKL